MLAKRLFRLRRKVRERGDGEAAGDLEPEERVDGGSAVVARDTAL
jgi:hypothetical protein